MKKFSKMIGMVLAAASILGCAAMFSACGETGNGGNTGTTERVDYSVTVLDPTGAPMEGVTVKWGENGSAYTTLESGKATAKLAAGDYDIVLEGLSEIYKYAPVKATASDRDKTVSVEWNPEDGNIVYSVKVLYPDGSPAKGIRVQLCAAAEMGGTCTMLPGSTNADGIIYSIGAIGGSLYLRGLPSGEYEVQLIQVPAEYTYDGQENADSHYTGEKATAAKPDVTVRLKTK